jgi:uncharacterized protein with PIN domain
MCPDCGGELVERCHTAVEPHGEIHTDVWIECRRCGSQFTERELEIISKESQKEDLLREGD